MSSFIRTERNLYLRDRMTITLPECEKDGMHVTHFEVGENDIGNLREALRYGRGTRPGRYTKLTEKGIFWMSDTDAEKADHVDPVRAIEVAKAERVLINGLGLGMVLTAALSYGHVKHVDVVERDKRVIDLIGPHYLTDGRVVIHHADAMEQMKAWDADTRWDVAWTDIWPDLTPDNIPQMREFTAFYEERCKFHGNWGEEAVKQAAFSSRQYHYLTEEEVAEFEEAESSCWECGEYLDDCTCDEDEEE